MTVYRHRVRIDRPTHARSSGSGNATEDWEPFLPDVPCNIHASTGREQEGGAQINARIDTVIEMRWQPGIEPDMRIVNTYDGDRVYNIRAILPDDTQRKRIKFLCDTGLNSG